MALPWMEPLLAATDKDAVDHLVQRHQLNISDVALLKEHSAQFYFDQPAEAVRIARAAQQLAEQLPAPASALGNWTLANALMFAEQYQAAADLYTISQQEYLLAGEALEAARMGVGQVWALGYLGQFSSALQLAAEIEPILITADNQADQRRLGSLYNNMGIVYELSGQFEEALSAYDRKLALLPPEEELQRGRVQHNRGVALTWLNAFSEALTAFDLAEKAFVEAGAITDLVRLWFNRGILHASRNDNLSASGAFQIAKNLLANQSEPILQAECELYDLLNRLQTNMLPDDALITDWKRLQATFAQHGPLVEEGLAWLGLARSYMLLKRLEEADNALQQVLHIVEVGGSTLAWQVLFCQAELAEMRQDEMEAIARYEQALVELESMRHRLKSDIFRATFLTDKLVVYQQLTLIYVRRGEMEAAVAIMERGRSRLLLERLMSRLTMDLDALVETDVPQFAQLQALLAEIEALSRTLRGTELGERGGFLVDVPPEQRLHLRGLEIEAATLVKDLQHLPNQQWPLTLQPISSLPEIQSALKDAVLLYYYLTPGWVNCVLITQEQIINYPALVSIKKLEEVRHQFAVGIDRAMSIAAHYGLARFNRYLLPLLTDIEKHLGQLYDWLWRPVSTRLPEKVIVVPEGPLHYLPFHALYDQAAETAAYVIERHAVSYAPSATILDWCRRLQPQGDGILLLGYGGSNLPQVTVELETLRQRWPQAIHLSGTEATTAIFQQLAPRSRLIHLAAHARFRADEVMLSAFTLADRPLTLLEISRLQLSAELAVLSGCETGSGRLHGNDLFSLATGFLGSGVRTLLVTLWRVDDSITAELMDRFYSEWAAGADPATALRRAQCWLLQQSRLQPDLVGYRHPAYWAPFSILGAA